MGSIDIFKSSREAYRSKYGFDEHTTTRHSVTDSFGDQLRGAWFCAQKWLSNPTKDPQNSPSCYPFHSFGEPNGKVSNTFLDVAKKRNNEDLRKL